MELFVSEEDYANLSSYAKFMIGNRGYDFYNKKTNHKMDKWEVFSFVEKNNHDHNLLSLNRHPFIEKRKR